MTHRVSLTPLWWVCLIAQTYLQHCHYLVDNSATVLNQDGINIRDPVYSRLNG